MTCKQAVLLAAGSGSRLRERTEAKHKCMVEVAGTPIVDNLYDALETLGIEELVVVTGYLREVLTDHLQSRERNLRLRFVENEHHAATNNIYSLWLARELIEPPFLLLECDVFLEPAVLQPLLVPDRMLVSTYTQDMDGTGVAVSARGDVTRLVLGRNMRKEDRSTLRKTVNLYSFSRSTWSEQLEPASREHIEAGDVDCFYEAALGCRIETGGVRMTAIDVTDKKWIEIDSPEDLTRAETMFSR